MFAGLVTVLVRPATAPKPLWKHYRFEARGYLGAYPVLLQLCDRLDVYELLCNFARDYDPTPFGCLGQLL